MKINAKCLKFNILEQKGAAYTSDGYMLPCCWLDDPPVHNFVKKMGLKDPELALENNEKLEDIFGSQQWENFFQLLLNEPDKCSYMCKKKCGEDLSEVEEEIRKHEEKAEILKAYAGKNY